MAWGQISSVPWGSVTFGHPKADERSPTAVGRAVWIYETPKADSLRYYWIYWNTIGGFLPSTVCSLIVCKGLPWFAYKSKLKWVKRCNRVWLAAEEDTVSGRNCWLSVSTSQTLHQNKMQHPDSTHFCCLLMWEHNCQEVRDLLGIGTCIGGLALPVWHVMPVFLDLKIAQDPSLPGLSTETLPITTTVTGCMSLTVSFFNGIMGFTWKFYL